VVKSGIDIDHVRSDVIDLLSESQEGIQRVKKIVQDLKEFSHADSDDKWVFVDLHKGLDSTLNIAKNEFKYKGNDRKGLRLPAAGRVRHVADQPGVHEHPDQRRPGHHRKRNSPHRGRVSRATRSGSTSATTEAGSRPKASAASSTRSSRPSRWGSARGSVCRSPIPSSKSTEAASRWKSQPGNGARFRVCLPIRSAET
jgi:hypothetical protein